ncbi:hypothetical protein BGZ94_000786 [Podila epigama]|nr:hypothetical protein BGZ94_000786 [Podila epigama]
MLGPGVIRAGSDPSQDQTRAQEQDSNTVITSSTHSQYESLANAQARQKSLPPENLQEFQQGQSLSKSRIAIENSSSGLHRTNSLSKRTIVNPLNTSQEDRLPGSTEEISRTKSSTALDSLEKQERDLSLRESIDRRSLLPARRPYNESGKGGVVIPSDAGSEIPPKSRQPSSETLNATGRSVEDRKACPGDDNGEDWRRNSVSSSHSRDKSRVQSPGSYRAMYAYPDNKNVVTWTATDPKTATSTSMTLLDTRPVMDSKSILSQTRRVSDKKLWQHQKDIERELLSSQGAARSGQWQEEISLTETSHLSDRSLRKNGGEESVSMENGINQRSSSRQERRSSKALSSKSSTSRGLSKTGSLSFEKSERSVPLRTLHRTLSSQIFIPNPRGIAPACTPDQSTELVRHSGIHADNELEHTEEHARRVHERMRRYEEQLDRRIQDVQDNNFRLSKLKYLLDEHERLKEIEAAQSSQDDMSQEEQRRKEEALELEGERLEWEKAKVLLEQSQIIQEQQKDDLEYERRVRKELEMSVAQMSGQIQELLQLGEAHAKEKENEQIKAAQDKDQWQETKIELELRNKELKSELERMTLEAAAAANASSESASVQDLTSMVDAFKINIKDLENQLKQGRKKAETTVSQQREQADIYKARIRELEKQQAEERERLLEDQETRTRVLARVNELVEKVDQKEEEVQDLRRHLGEREALLERRQGQLDEALEIIRSLEDKRQDAARHTEFEQKRLALTSAQSNLQEMGKELAKEKEANRKHQEHIEILLETQQECTLLHESKIRQLQEELDMHTQQLSQTAGSLSTSSSTINKLQTQIQEQEQILLEKEDRIQELEQELRLAQQQAQSVVADLEQDMQESEHERLKVSSQLQKIHSQMEDEKAKVKLLEDQLQQEQGLSLELERRQDREIVLLESLLGELDGHPPEVDLAEMQLGVVDSLFGQLRNRLGEFVQERAELLEQRAYHEQTLEEQRQQLDQYESEIETLQEQLMRMEEDRKTVEEQVHLLQDDLDLARHQQQQLREQVRSKDMLLKERATGSSTSGGLSKSQLGLTSSQQQHQQQQQQQQQQRQQAESSAAASDALRQQISRLEQQVSVLEDEKRQAVEQLEQSEVQIQKMEEMIQDQTEAAKSIREKYMSKITALQHEVVKHRKTVVQQEGRLFLYLSVIEKLKLQQRGNKVEPQKQLPAVTDANESAISAL